MDLKQDERVRATAVCLAVLSLVDHGTRLLTILHEHGIPPFDYEEFGIEPQLAPNTLPRCEGSGRSKAEYPVRVSPPRRDPYTRAVFWFRWEHTGSWPPWVESSWHAPTDTAIDSLEEHACRAVCNRFAPEWQEDETIFIKAMDLAHKQENRANPHSLIPSRHIKIWALWERMISPWKFNQLMKATARVLALDLTMRLGFRWFTNPKNAIVKELEIDLGKVKDIAQNGCDMLIKRLREGPLRPYADTTYADLIRAIDVNTRANGSYDSYAYLETSVNKDGESGPANPENATRLDTFLNLPPATDTEISDLEARFGLHEPLPAPYREFLKTTNGLSAIWWNGTQLLRLLGPLSSVRILPESDAPPTITLTLIDDRELYGEDMIDWPPLPRIVIFSEGGHEGDVWLCDDAGKKRLQRLAEETYGSLDELRNLKGATIMWNPWFAETRPYRDVRHLLEDLAEGSQAVKRPWPVVFDPGLKKLDSYLYLPDDEVAERSTIGHVDNLEVNANGVLLGGSGNDNLITKSDIDH
ncbi:hypothetical protein DL766_007936 [Monosporascus sp. MC13-8B]|uniref:Knr4/Smi1-like domain-containing protein n=1 Tax=Monosporascus cannonballus TaxID=155416 RepID=A0ABY0GSU6_9PEZI|nr:hypothetical protein DL762_009744 [Monosporascus cannonballus]RYO81351.1 hypothetical protein DL763_008601 [Monosporascus cannonballus]RYP21427.1 hypothetical protein DL766_007936 [Monosporascus sp. MC13-8B]